MHPDRVFTKAGARPGDVLVLSKPLGTGIVLAGGTRRRQGARPSPACARSTGRRPRRCRRSGGRACTPSPTSPASACSATGGRWPSGRAPRLVFDGARASALRRRPRGRGEAARAHRRRSPATASYLAGRRRVDGGAPAARGAVLRPADVGRPARRRRPRGVGDARARPGSRRSARSSPVLLGESTLRPRVDAARAPSVARRWSVELCGMTGHEVVVGIDEVGRGAWAGPLMVGAAVLPARPAGRQGPRLEDAHRGRARAAVRPHRRVVRRLGGRSRHRRRSATSSGMADAQRLAARAGDRRPRRRARRGRSSTATGTSSRARRRREVRIVKADATCLSVAGGVDPRQGHPRPDHARGGRALPGLRLRRRTRATRARGTRRRCRPRARRRSTGAPGCSWTTCPGRACESSGRSRHSCSKPDYSLPGYFCRTISVSISKSDFFETSTPPLTRAACSSSGPSPRGSLRHWPRRRPGRHPTDQ